MDSNPGASFTRLSIGGVLAVVVTNENRKCSVFFSPCNAMAVAMH